MKYEDSGEKHTKSDLLITCTYLIISLSSPMSVWQDKNIGLSSPGAPQHVQARQAS